MREYGAPATVYVSSYYSFFNRPVFDTMLSYLLWKGADQTLSWPEVLGDGMRLNPLNRSSAWRQISGYANNLALDARAKDALLAELAGRLHIDYGDVCSRRILQLMNSDQLRSLATGGVNLQLHTHRHRMPPQKGLLIRGFKTIERLSARLITAALFRTFAILAAYIMRTPNTFFAKAESFRLRPAGPDSPLRHPTSTICHVSWTRCTETPSPLKPG